MHLLYSEKQYSVIASVTQSTFPTRIDHPTLNVCRCR